MPEKYFRYLLNLILKLSKDLSQAIQRKVECIVTNAELKMTSLLRNTKDILMLIVRFVLMENMFY